MMYSKFKHTFSFRSRSQFPHEDGLNVWKIVMFNDEMKKTLYNE